MYCSEIAFDMHIACWRQGAMSGLEVLDCPGELTLTDLRDSPINVGERSSEVESMASRQIV
jgi:hypothetical protein